MLNQCDVLECRVWGMAITTMNDRMFGVRVCDSVQT